MIQSGRVRYHPRLSGLFVDIDTVHPAPYNYNNGDMDEVVASILLNGMYDAVKVQSSTGYVIAGCTTWTACKELEAEVIPAIYLDVDDVTARSIMAADNETARKARPDPGLLLDLLKTVEQQRGTVVGTGTSAHDLRALEALSKVSLSQEWAPTERRVTFTVETSPEVIKGFRYLTREADTPADAFELLLRLAGWSPR